MGPPSSFMCSHHSLPDALEMRGNPWVMSTSTCPPSLLRSEAWDHPISTKLCRSCKNKCYISPSVAKNDLGFSSCNGKESPQKERHTAAPMDRTSASGGDCPGVALGFQVRVQTESTAPFCSHRVQLSATTGYAPEAMKWKI